MTNSPSEIYDEVQLIGRGELRPPGHCMMCLNGNCDEGYVRLNVYYDYEGEQYICVPCVSRVINAVNGLTLAESERLRSDASAAMLLYKGREEELRAANERLKHYDALFAGIGAPTIASSPGPGQGVVQAESSSPADDPQTANATNSGEPVSEESVKSDGPDDVTRSTGSDITSRKRKLQL